MVNTEIVNEDLAKLTGDSLPHKEVLLSTAKQGDNALGRVCVPGHASIRLKKAIPYSHYLGSSNYLHGYFNESGINTGNASGVGRASVSHFLYRTPPKFAHVSGSPSDYDHKIYKPCADFSGTKRGERRKKRKRTWSKP